jgi:hypothetical protein
VLGGSLDLGHLTTKSLGRVSGRTSSQPAEGRRNAASADGSVTVAL